MHRGLTTELDAMGRTASNNALKAIISAEKFAVENKVHQFTFPFSRSIAKKLSLRRTLRTSFSANVNDIQILECVNRQIPSSNERYITSFGMFMLIQPRTDPPKLLR